MTTSTLSTLYAERTALAAEIEQLETAQVPAHDVRLTDMWDSAAEIADEHSMCSVYDEIVGELGGITRERTYSVRTVVTIRYEINLTTEASSESDAIDNIDNMDSYDIIDGLMRDAYSISRDDIEVENIDAREGEVI